MLLRIFPLEVKAIPGGKSVLLGEKAKLGKWSSGEKATTMVFILAIILWVSSPFWGKIFPPKLAASLSWVDEYVIAMFASLLLFIIPVDWKKREFALSWSDSKSVDWGTLLLFGGGIALSDALFKTGIARWIAQSSVGAIGHPSTLVLVIVIVLLIDFLTEITSNTAVTTMMVPVVISIAKGTGTNPTTLAIAVAVASSMAFMLPVATPPNALVYGTGYISIKDMVKAGFILDIVGWIATVGILYIFGYLVFGVLLF
jgi:sodium-dependent dicarboxylate transporter 2/3/5